jgi:hypothetical protein
MAGGLSAKIIACWEPERAPNDLPASVAALFSLPPRSSQGFKGTKMIAAFWPLPKKLKPSTEITWRTWGCAMKKSSASSTATWVRSRVARRTGPGPRR